MEIIKEATEWAKAEVFSAQFFIIFGLMFALASLGFWQWSKTDVAKAFIIPTLVAGILLLVIGVGLVYTNKNRLTKFPKDYTQNPTEFVQSEMQRAKKTVAEFKNVVFTAIPLIIVIAALLIIFINKPIWRATCITTIAMMIVIMLIDSNSSRRMQEYQEALQQYKTKKQPHYSSKKGTEQKTKA